LILFTAGFKWEQAPELNYDYFIVNVARNYVNKGKFDKAIEAIRKARRLYFQEPFTLFGKRDQRPIDKITYLPWGEIQIAKLLTKKEKYEVAKLLLKETLELPKLYGDTRKQIETMLKEIEDKQVAKGNEKEIININSTKFQRLKF